MNIDFNKGKGLVPAIIQEYGSDKILMLGFMNEQALKKTLQTGYVYFYSRTKKRLWKKGEESGNTLEVMEILTDCDSDSLLIKAVLHGKNCCHTGEKSCFFTKTYDN